MLAYPPVDFGDRTDYCLHVVLGIRLHHLLPQVCWGASLDHHRRCSIRRRVHWYGPRCWLKSQCTKQTELRLHRCALGWSLLQAANQADVDDDEDRIKVGLQLTVRTYPEGNLTVSL